MSLTVTKLGDDLYTATTTAPYEPWSTSEPLSRERLRLELAGRGVHPIDAVETIDRLDPLEMQVPPERYPGLRAHALRADYSFLWDHPIQQVAMEQIVGGMPVTVHARADGAASVWLGKGGGYVEGDEKIPAIRRAALEAIERAKAAQQVFRATISVNLPSPGEVYFYLRTGGDQDCLSAGKPTRPGGDAAREFSKSNGASTDTLPRV
jgi:hypothetical protein